jgi:hypothetical protein
MAAAPAGAAWTPSVPLPFAPDAIRAGAAPGQVVFAGVGEDEATQWLLRTPASQTLLPLTSPVPRGESAEYGDGGAVAYIDPEAATLHLGTLAGAGTYTPAGTLAVDPEDSVSAVAAAGDGSVAVLFTDGEARLHLALARPGGAVSDEVVSVPTAAVDLADVAPLGTGGYGLAWTENDETAYVIAGLRVRPDGVVDRRTTLVGENVPADATLSDIQVPAGVQNLTAVWTAALTAPSERTVVRLSVEGAETREIASTGTNDPVSVATRAFPSGRLLVSVGVEPEDTDPYAITELVAPGTTGQECMAPAGRPYDASVLVPGAIALVGVDGAGAIVRQDVREDCTVTTVAGPETTGSTVAAAGVDGEGSLVVVTGDDGSGGLFTVDDRTPPTLTGLKVPSRVVAGERFSASVAASDTWDLDSVSWRLDGRAFDDDATASGRAPDAGEHRLEVTATDAAGNRTRASATLTVVADGPGAPPPPGTPPGGDRGPGADVPLPKPSKPGKKKPRNPSDPTVRIRSVQETSKGWVLRLRVSNASRVRLRLYRERYLGAGKLRRPLTCPVRPRPLRRPPSGLRGRTTVVVNGSSVALRIPRPLADALTKRGRYTLSVVALGTGSKARTASAAANRSFTAC